MLEVLISVELGEMGFFSKVRTKCEPMKLMMVMVNSCEVIVSDLMKGIDEGEPTWSVQCGLRS